MDNDANAMVKRSLVLTAKLVGAFALWVTVLSFALVTLTSRMVGSLSGATATADDAAKSKDAIDAPRPNLKAKPGANAAKSNG